MATPHNAPYKKRQRAGRLAVKTRGTVLWVSCRLVDLHAALQEPPKWVKQAVQGTAYSDHRGGYVNEIVNTTRG